jgi:hypothetical protein
MKISQFYGKNFPPKIRKISESEYFEIVPRKVT